MKTKIFLSTIIVLAIASCTNSRTPDKSAQETPNALQEQDGSYKIITKRGDDDLIESLYNELLTKNIDLKQLECNREITLHKNWQLRVHRKRQQEYTVLQS